MAGGLRLEAIKLGGRVYTSVEALQRFGLQLSADRMEAFGVVDPRPIACVMPVGPKRASLGHEAAMDKLRAAGVAS